MILVTGGDGFIGRHLMKALKGDGVSWDIKTGKDLFSNDILPYVDKCKAIVHLAALSSTQKSMDEPEATYKLNVQGTLRMLLLAGMYKRKLVFISSAAVYKDIGRNSYREIDELDSSNPYGMSKIDAEYSCASFRRRVPIVVLRLFNVYGSGQNPEYAGVISGFLQQMKDGVLAITGDGNQTRDFINVTDVVKIIMEAIDDNAWNGKTVNVGTGRATSINELAAIFKNANKNILRLQYTDERKEIKYSAADTLFLRSLYRDDLTTNLKEDIKKMIKEHK